MIGSIFQNFEAFTIEVLGEAAWDEILRESDLSSPQAAYSSLGLYPDSDLESLLVATTERSGLETADLLEDFGVFLVKRFSERYAEFFHSADDLFGFLESVDRHIHVQIRKLRPDAETPSVEVFRVSAAEATLVYRSPRKLCALARGMIKGAAKYYHAGLSLEELQCAHDGADECRFHLRLES